MNVFAKDDLLKDLGKEKKAITKEIKKIQEKYFVARTISKREYDDLKNSYEDRLAEIEDEELTLKKMQNKTVKKG